MLLQGRGVPGPTNRCVFFFQNIVFMPWRTGALLRNSEMKQELRDYLSFTKKERVGILFLLLIVLLLAIAPSFFPKKMIDGQTLRLIKLPEHLKPEKALHGKKKEFPVSREPAKDLSLNDIEAPVNRELFNFDPNLLDEAGWKRLGINKRVVSTIMNYRLKGGRFRRQEDLLRIYGLSEDEKKRLVPYVAIAAEPAPYTLKTTQLETQKAEPVHKKNPVIIDINTADTLAWKNLPGIGSVLSARINKFRDKLGGFFSIEQVAEIYGLTDSSFQIIKPYLTCVSPVKKININEAGLEVLKDHPYIRLPLARFIVDYRSQHGKFERIEDLQKLIMVTPEIFEKMAPYLYL